MILKAGKRGIVTVIMNKMKGPGSLKPSLGSGTSEEGPSLPMPMSKPKSTDGTDMDNDIAYRSCCENMLGAIKAEDSQRLKSAMKSFVSMMMDEYDSKKDED